MRILAVQFPNEIEISTARRFLRFSSRVSFREEGWVFLDIQETRKILGGENRILEQVEIEFSRVHLALADTPWGAQILAHHFGRFHAAEGQEAETFLNLSCEGLLFFDGLIAWPSLEKMRQLIASFQSVGLTTMRQLVKVSLPEWSERWGVLGEEIHSRLHGQCQQVISPLTPDEPIYGYSYIDEPVLHLPLLLHEVHRVASGLFEQMRMRGLFLREGHLRFHCEYAKAILQIEVKPSTANRDLDLFMDLTKQRLETSLSRFQDKESTAVSEEIIFEMSLNPVREFELYLDVVSENRQQFDFFEPQHSDQDKLDRLVSLLTQAGLQAGFYHLREALLPEETFSLQTHSAPAFSPQVDQHLHEGGGLRLLPAHSAALTFAPRPNRILQKPALLARQGRANLKILSRFPVERIEGAWWEGLLAGPVQRDYFFAISNHGQRMWIFQERASERWYVHGYFD